MDRFDPDSGQVYHETVVKRERIKFREWNRIYNGRRPSDFLSQRGADSLTAMVLRRLVCHAEQLTPEALAGLPATTAHQIRTTVRREGCETLDIFKRFAESGHADKTCRFATSTISFYKPLVNYFLDLVSPKFSWMVDLSLKNLYCSRLDLRQLSTLDNLQTLFVHYSNVTGDEPFDDDVLSHLSFRASTDNALSKLTMIFVCNAPGVSRQTFPSICRFPSLETFCVVETTIRAKDVRQYQSFGWDISKEPIFQIDGDGRSARMAYDSVKYGLTFAERVNQFIEKRRSCALTGFWTLPSANVSFGSRPFGSRNTRGDISGMICFTRDLNLSKGSSHSGAEAAKRKAGQNVNDTAMNPRRAKATKIVRLDTMLERL